MDEQTKQPTMSLTVVRRQLCNALAAMDLSGGGPGPANDRVELFCRDGQFVVRQGYIEQSVDCSNSFAGQFSIAVSSLQKWKRAQKSSAGDETLSFSDGQLKVATASLPVRWQTEVRGLAYSAPRIVKPMATNMPSGPQASPELPATLKTCGNFRVNADRNELIDAILRHTRASTVSDLYLRTWGGKLILDSGRLEVRVDAEGKIDGFSVIPAQYLRKLALLRANEEKFTNLICEGFDLRILGVRIKTPRKALPIEYVRSVAGDASLKT